MIVLSRDILLLVKLFTIDIKKLLYLKNPSKLRFIIIEEIRASFAL